MAIDAGQLAGDIFNAARGVVTDRWQDGSAVARDLAQDIAEFAVLAEAAIASGGLDEQGISFMRNRVVKQAREFALTLANLVVAAAAALFDAVIGVVWSALRTALSGTGFGHVLPSQPNF